MKDSVPQKGKKSQLNGPNQAIMAAENNKNTIGLYSVNPRHLKECAEKIPAKIESIINSTFKIIICKITGRALYTHKVLTIERLHHNT